jgi:large subunit ribosomal protein L21
MYAIVDIAGQQFKVQKDQKIFVHRLEGQEGAEVQFDKVLLLDNDGAVKVGTPIVEGVRVSGKILTHLKGDKVLVFKKKRRKGYQKLNGHRQYLSQILIENITLGTAKKATKKAAAKAVPEVEAEAEAIIDTPIAEAPVAETKPKRAPRKKATEE